MAEITSAPGYRESGLGWPAAAVAGGAEGGTGRPASAVAPAGVASLESGLGFRLGRAHRLVRELWEEAIADLELSPPQSALLRAVTERPGSGVREIARRMRTDPMNVKRLADHLERAGLLRSVSDPRHRQRRVLRPTGEGTVLAGELAGRASAQERHLSELLGAADLSRLMSLLEHLESALAPTAPATEEAS